MYCPECGSTDLRYGFSGGDLFGDSWSDIYCMSCKKSFHIVEREQTPIQIKIDTSIWPEEYIRAEDIMIT